MEQLASGVQWLRSQRPVWMAVMRNGAQSIQSGLRDATQRTERWIERGLIALAASRTAANAAACTQASASEEPVMDYATLDAEPWDARALGYSDSSLDEASAGGGEIVPQAIDAWNQTATHPVSNTDSDAADAGLLPSGRAANLFVFVLSNVQSYEVSSPVSSSQLPATSDSSDGIDRSDVLGAEFADAFAMRNATNPSDANAIAAGPCYPNEACFPYEPFSVERDAQVVRDAAPATPEFESVGVLSSPSTEDAPESIAPEDLVIAEPISRDDAIAADGIQQCGPGYDRFETRIAAAPDPAINQEPVGSETRVLAPSEARLGTADWAAANSIRFGCLESEWIEEPSQSPCRPPVLSAPDDEPLPAYASNNAEVDSASPSLHALSLDAQAAPDNVVASEDGASVIASDAMWVGMAMQEGRAEAAPPTGPRLAAMPQAGPLGGDSTAESEVEALRDAMQPEAFATPLEPISHPQPTHPSFEPYPPITESMDAAWIDADVRETLRVRPFEYSPWTDCDLNAPAESEVSDRSDTDSQPSAFDSSDALYLDSIRCLGFE
jgi:hypothetical protein